MSENTYKEPEPVEPEKKEKPKKKRKANPVIKGLQSVLDGTILAKDSVLKGVPVVLYATLLIVLYIANTYYAERKIIEIEKIKNELKELRSENITTKSKLDTLRLRSKIIEYISPYRIKESLIPPHKIFVQNDTTVKATVNND